MTASDSTTKDLPSKKNSSVEPESNCAASGGAVNTESSEAFVLSIPFTVDHLIGRDPDALPKYRRTGIAAVRCTHICESLFWVVQQLGNMVENNGWIYSRNDLAGALDSIGEVGKAVAQGASGETQHLEFAAERLHTGQEE